MMKISWVDQVTNKEVVRRGEAKRKIMKSIRKRPMVCLANGKREEGLEVLILIGRIK